MARILMSADAGWSSSVARWAHNPEVAGSNPVPATQILTAPFWGPSVFVGVLSGSGRSAAVSRYDGVGRICPMAFACGHRTNRFSREVFAIATLMQECCARGLPVPCELTAVSVLT